MSPSPDSKKQKRFKPRPIEVLHHDEDVIVINTPPAVFLDLEPFDHPCILKQLSTAGIIGENDTLHPAYPHDAQSSGALLLTREKETADKIAAQLENHAFELCHLALVRAFMSTESDTVDRPLADHSGDGGLAVVDEKRGRPAVTNWRVRDTFIGFALLECFPRTPTPGQVRAHMEAEGMPLVVDPSYGGAKSLMLSSFKAGYKRSQKHPERPLIQRPSIHLSSLSFKHPRTGETLQYEAPPPKDFRATLHQLDRFGRVPAG